MRSRPGVMASFYRLGRRGPTAASLPDGPRQREVQLEDVDPGLAEEAEERPWVCVRDESPAPRRYQAGRLGDARHLAVRVCRGDVRVEAAAPTR